MTSSWNEAGIYSIQVEGAWTVSTVTSLLQQAALQSLKISECALHFVESNPGSQLVTEINLNGITEIDDSGCRILNLWLEHLQDQGFNPKVINQDGAIYRRVAGYK